ncbi:MAG: 50S ribosomal protein L6 [Pelagibacteraceae bacterium]|nr:50S ribosomal protein L6 [Pelagibacteraceae bacterium]|tara:strand:+ start:1511 stop:2029 length:519 start_codon:yes stop_codon:yes gene_type:complete
MSRLAKNPIIINDGVKVSMNDNILNVEGKLGKSATTIPKQIKLNIENNSIILNSDDKALLGTLYANIKNEIHGNSVGFEKKLELVGTGYKANLNGKVLVLSLGFSHDINFKIPENISIKVEKSTNLSISGPSKQLVGQVAAEIKSYRKPEPYKGKGVRYEGEKIYRKEGKKK